MAHNENEIAFIIEVETAPKMVAAASALLINALILKIISNSQRGTQQLHIIESL